MSSHEDPPSPPPDAEAARWVERFSQAWSDPRNPDSFSSRVGDLLAPDVKLIQPWLAPIDGREAFRRDFVEPLFALVPDISGNVERWAFSRHSLFVELTIAGTVGRRQVSWRVCDRITLRDGLAIERVSHLDPLPLLGAALLSPCRWPALGRMLLPSLRNPPRTQEPR